MKEIYQYLDNEIKKALPENWRFIPNDKLLGKDDYKISYAFNSSGTKNKSKLINILVLNSGVELNEYTESRIIKLRDYIISKDCLFVVIVEQENSKYLNDTGIFESENLKLNHKNYISFYCYQDQKLKTTVDGIKYEDLNQVIRDLWSGKLNYDGISKGSQFVNLELMNDECWKCKRKIRTVTGIVFPNIQLETWSNKNWLYFNQLYPLSKINSKNAEKIKSYIKALRQNDDSIGIVDYKYSNSVKSKYFASSCPICNSLRGDFHVQDERMKFLHDLDNRLNGNLSYYSIELNINEIMIENLDNGFEGCPHTCIMGWNKQN